MDISRTVQLFLSCLLLCKMLPLVFSDNYLVVFAPVPGSHMLILTSVVETMIARNHSVTLVAPEGDTTDRIKKQISNNNYLMETHKSSLPTDSIDSKEYMKLILTGSTMEIMRFVSTKLPAQFQSTCEDVFQDKELLKRLGAQQFDLILMNSVFACPVLIAQHLNISYATIFPALPPSMYNRLLCNSVNPAYSPESFTGYSDRMSFSERVKNTLLSGFMWMLSEYTMRSYDKVKRKYNIRPEISTFQSLGEAQLFFINSHFVLEFPRPYQPNMVSVGGLTAYPPKQIPQDLEAFMQSSGDHGVIIFSMGSYVNAMETAMANMFAEAFSKIPQKVLWKSSGEPPSSIPPNVKILEWIPQNDILGHPKTRAIVYHCGVNGVYEAIYHAVPVICIPVQSDQWDNARRLREKRVGLQLSSLFTMNSNDLVEAINTIIGNDSYQSNMTRLSAIFRDEHLHPTHRLVHWMEKAVHHGGLGHLRSSAFKLNSIQHNLLDVVTFLIVVSGLVVIIVGFICFRSCRFLSRCCSRAVTKQKVQ